MVTVFEFFVQVKRNRQQITVLDGKIRVTPPLSGEMLEAAKAIRDEIIDSWHLRQLQDHGIRPPSFTKAVTCKRCGQVWDREWADDNPETCAWCFRNFRGEIPRPERRTPCSK
jgi:hypothetical protein